MVLIIAVVVVVVCKYYSSIVWRNCKTFLICTRISIGHEWSKIRAIPGNGKQRAKRKEWERVSSQVVNKWWGITFNGLCCFSSETNGSQPFSRRPFVYINQRGSMTNNQASSNPSQQTDLLSRSPDPSTRTQTSCCGFDGKNRVS